MNMTMVPASAIESLAPDIQPFSHAIWALADHLKQPVLISDSSHRIVHANSQALELWGLDRLQLGTYRFNQLIHPVDRATYESAQTSIQLGEPGRPMRLRLITPGGHCQIGQLVVTRSDVGSQLFYTHVVDSVESQQQEEPPVLDSVHSSFKTQYAVVVNTQGLILAASELFKTLVGVSPDSSINGAPLERFLQTTETMPAGSSLFNAHLRCSGNQLLSVQAERTAAQFEGQACMMVQLAKTSSVIWRTIVRQYALTQRESDVVLALCQGQPSDRLAAQLRIAPATVRTHLRNIFTKMNVNSRIELVCTVFHLLVNDLNGPPS